MSTWSICFLFFQAISAAMSSFSIMSLSLLIDKCFRRLIVFMHHRRWIMNILRFLVSSFRSFQHSDSFSNTDFTLLWKPWVCSCCHKWGCSNWVWNCKHMTGFVDSCNINTSWRCYNAAQMWRCLHLPNALYFLMQGSCALILSFGPL